MRAKPMHPRYGDLDKEFFRKGYFYLSPNDTQAYYLVTVRIKEKGEHAIARIYESDIPEEPIENGAYVTNFKSSLSLVASLDIWAKYYFPTFRKPYKGASYNAQWYHEMSNCPSNRIQAFADVLKFALNLAVSKAGIKPR